jgi:D-alanyl-D-alanine carboxypeptidase
MKGSPEEAAKSVAPPGYSEHHTGYAVDLVDGYVPNADINGNFAETKAFQWLTQRAKEFGYELSFPENNLQSVKYEPWHWRFVASSKAAEIFRDARN